MSVPWPLIAVAAGALCAFFVAEHFVRRALRRLSRHTGILADHTHHPFRWFCATIRVRALVSAKDAGTLWDLRCLVRERLVNWIQTHEPDSRPRIRVDNTRTELSPRSPGEETIQRTS